METDGDDLERLSLLWDLERELAGKDPRHGRVLDAVRGLLDDAERDAPTTRSQDGAPDRAGRRRSHGHP